ncbi:MAG: SPOR domain-containing protein [Sphingomonadales bacterium]|nr:SPOR domain-containing protein [Sphingomonadales bacterium]MDE2567570.1 SPOR domain-containing protein [Sphingomonadales bacterium]
MTPTVSATRGARLAALLLACTGPSAIAASQESAPVVSQPVVQGTRPSTSTELNEALIRVARNPRDVDALIDAGSAALRLGDVDAALGFFRRADEVSPGNPQIKAKIAGAMVRANRPVEAIGYYDDAERAGGDTASFAADRGLAYDLVGDNGTAQRWYQVALARDPANDEVRRRYALSLAIAGDQRAADSVLGPLIQRQDRSAWRVRTFVMAISGKDDEAVSIARATMPPDLADGIAPYLRYMPRLTRAQQAAAANFGRFPRAADIGRDDQTVRQYALAHPSAPAVGAGLVPSGEPLGAGGAGSGKVKVSREKRRRPGRGGEEDQARLASATPQPAAALTAPAAEPPAPPTASRSPQGELPALKHPEPMAVASPQTRPTPTPTPTLTPTLTPQPAPVRVAQAERPAAVTPTPVPAPAPAPSATPPSSTRVTVTPGFTSVWNPHNPDQEAPRVVTKEATPTPSPTPAPPPSAPTPTPTPAPVLARQLAPASAPAPASNQTPSRSTFDLAMIDKPSRQQETAASSAIAAPAPASTPAPTPAPAPVQPRPEASAPTNDKPVDFSAAFDSFEPPASEARPTVAAVDLAKIEPTRGPSPEERRAAARALAEKQKAEAEAAAAKAKAEAEARKQRELERANPARVWVQVSTGANRGWMDEEWAKVAKQAPKLLAKRSAWVTPWNRVYRLLTGPFKTEAEARSFLNELSKEKVDGFIFSSDAGQVIDKIKTK